MSNFPDQARCAEQILDEKYRLKKLIGSGGMGEVWRAEHLMLGSRVAIKFMTEQHANTETGRKRFLREAQVVASLRGNGIVQILDFGVHNGTSYLVMELLDGTSLEKHLEAERRLTPTQTALVMNQVGRAVDRAHCAGIVHRDLKPANIFLLAEDETEPEGSSEMPLKLLDFGIAKDESSTKRISKATNTGQFLGSPQYASPEQAQGLRTVDRRTDIWSMGVIAYECLLGRLPFEGETPTQVLVSVCAGPLPVPSEKGEVPSGFDAWFAKACSRELNRRYETALDAAGALDQVLAATVQPAVAAANSSPASEPPAPVSAPPAIELDPQFSDTLISDTLISDAPEAQKAKPQEAKRPQASGKAKGKAPGRKKRFRPEPRQSEPRGLHRIGSTHWWPLVALAGLLLLVGNGALRGLSWMNESSTAVLHVAGDPTQALFVDNRKIAQLPTAYRMTAGQHQIQIRRGPRYLPFEQVLSSTGLRDVTRFEAVQLKVLKGRLSLEGDSTTQGAQITLLAGLESRFLGTVPLVVDIDTRVRNSILVARPGYDAFFQPIFFADGRAEQLLHIRLQEIPTLETLEALEVALPPLVEQTPLEQALAPADIKQAVEPADLQQPVEPVAQAPQEAIITEKEALTPASPAEESLPQLERPVEAEAETPQEPSLPFPSPSEATPRAIPPRVPSIFQVPRLRPQTPGRSRQEKKRPETSRKLRKKKRQQRMSERAKLRKNRGPTGFVDVRGQKKTRGLNPGKPGGLTGRAVDERATNRAYTLRPCWETWKRQYRQSREVTVALVFRISFHGRVDSIENVLPVQETDALATCVISAAKSWVFPKAGIGTLARLRFVFQGR